MCVWTFSTIFVWNLSHSKKWARYGQKYTSVFTWSTVILCNFNETWIFSSYFRKNPRTSNFAKIRPVGVKLFQADTSCYLQTDRHDTANNTTCNFANVPEAGTLSQCLSIPLCYLAIGNTSENTIFINPLNTKLNPTCHLLALLAHHILHISRIRVKCYTCLCWLCV